MSILSLPRARRASERRLLAMERIRLISPATRRLTRIWLAFTETTSADTTEISEVRRVSTSLMWEVTVARLEVNALRRFATWREAWERAARRSFTVLEKRESARAACLARESLRPLVAAARRLSTRARLAASLRYLVELVVRVDLGLGDGVTEVLHGTSVTGGIRGTGTAKSSSGALALSVDLVEDRGGGSLDLLGGLGTESKLGASLGGDGTRDHASDTALVAGELHEESLAGHGGSGTGAGRLAHESEHLALTGSDGETEVLLGDGRGGTDGVHHLLLELSAGSLGLECDGLEGRVGLLGELGHLSLKTEGHGSLGLLVHGLANLEDSGGTTLTLLDGGAEGALKLGLVGLLEGCNELAAGTGASLVAAHNTGELGDSLVGLLVVL